VCNIGNILVNPLKFNGKYMYHFNIKALLVCLWSRCSTLGGKIVGDNGEVQNEGIRTSKL